MNRRTAVLGLIASPVALMFNRVSPPATADGDYIIRGEIFRGEDVQLENDKTYVDCLIVCDRLHLGNARVLHSHICRFSPGQWNHACEFVVRPSSAGGEVSYSYLYNSEFSKTNFRTLPSMPAGYEYARR